MKRTPRLVLATSVIALVTLFLSSLVSAHPVTIDGAAGADWFSKSLLPRTNAGHILRNASNQGEYAWKDAAGTATRVGDQRLINATQSITKAVDLTQFRVTADATNLYFLAEMDVIPTSIPNGKLPQLQIAIQTPSGAHANSTLISPNGTVPVSTTVSASANWDFLVQTQFQAALAGPGARPNLYTSPASSSQVGSGTLTKSTGNTMELSIPWSSIGGKPAKDQHLRFTTAVLYSDGSAPADGADSKVMDAVSSASDTLAEVQDGDIDTFSDVYFDTNGEPYSPLLVSEVVPRPKNNSKSGQWVEIYNNSGVSFNLSGFKFGDEANRGGSPLATDTDGMYQLPNISLPAGQVLIVTRNKGEFDLLYAANTQPPQLPPGFNRVYTTNSLGSESGPNVLAKYTAWSNGKFDLKDRPTDPLNPVPFSDEQLILDQSDTLIDLVQYAVPGAAIYPGVTALPVPLAGIPSETSFQRGPASRDTNDHTLDFAVTSTFATQTPGNANTTTQTDLSIVKTGPTAQLVATQADYVLHYSNANANAVGATNVVISDTLPAGVAYVSEGASPPIAPSTEPVAGIRQWNLPTLNPGASGVITVTVTLPALPQVITNTAEISIAAGGAVTELDPSNNVSQFETNVTPVPQPDVGISKTLTNPGQAYPTGQAIYQIDYANTGDAPAVAVQIVDTIPAGLTYVSNSGGFTATPGAGTVTFDLGTQAAQASGTFNVVFDIAAGASVGGSLVNNVTIQTTSVPEFNPANNTAASQAATIQPRPAVDLNIAKSTTTTEVDAGGTVQYTITVGNNAAANATATGAIVTDLLASGLTYVAGSTTNGAGEPVIVHNQLTWTLPGAFDLAPGATKSFSFSVRVTSVQGGDSFSNTATVSGGGGVEPPASLGDNTATSGSTTVRPGFKLYLPLVVK